MFRSVDCEAQKWSVDPIGTTKLFKYNNGPTVVFIFDTHGIMKEINYLNTIGHTLFIEKYKPIKF